MNHLPFGANKLEAQNLATTTFGLAKLAAQPHWANHLAPHSKVANLWRPKIWPKPLATTTWRPKVIGPRYQSNHFSDQTRGPEDTAQLQFIEKPIPRTYTKCTPTQNEQNCSIIKTYTKCKSAIPARATVHNPQVGSPPRQTYTCPPSARETGWHKSCKAQNLQGTPFAIAQFAPIAKVILEKRLARKLLERTTLCGEKKIFLQKNFLQKRLDTLPFVPYGAFASREKDYLKEAINNNRNKGTKLWT